MMNNTAALRVPSSNPSPRSEVIERHVPLAKSIVARLRLTYGLNASFDDLYSLGLTGLMQAAERFDPARGASFATYAYHRIRGAVLDGLRRDPDVRLVDPLRAASLNSAFRASGIAANDNGRAGASGETLRDEPRWGLADPSTTYLMSSDAIDEIADEAAVHPDEEVGRRMLADRIRTAIAALPDAERQVVELHYYEDLSFSEIGARLGICKPWAFRLHNKAIERLRETLAELGDAALAALGA